MSYFLALKAFVLAAGAAACFSVGHVVNGAVLLAFSLVLGRLAIANDEA